MVSWPWQLFNCKDETMFSNKFRAKSCGFGFGRNTAEQTTFGIMFHRNRLKKYIKAGKGGLETYWSG